MGTPAGNGSRLCAYETAWNNQQHVFFVGGDKRVHELVYADHWYLNDVTGAATTPVQASIAVPTTALVGYVTTWNKQQHVIYLSAHGGPGYRIHELCYAGRWTHHDLITDATVPTQAPLAKTGSALAGYVTNRNQQQHVIYVGTDDHVHELCYAGRWYHHDLTKDGKAPVSAKAGSALSGTEITYSSSLDWQQSLAFVGNDGKNDHVYELLYAKAGWSCLDLNDNAVDGTPPIPATGTPLACFETPANEQRHILYVGASDKHVHELVHANWEWHTSDVTQTAYEETSTKPGPVYGGKAQLGGMVGFPCSGDFQFIAYVGADDGHVHQLEYTSQFHQWYTWDLSRQCGATTDPPANGSPITAYPVETEGGNIYVVYLDSKNHVCQLAPAAGDWHDLTQEYY
jgi:hypothetical protein